MTRLKPLRDCTVDELRALIADLNSFRFPTEKQKRFKPIVEAELEGRLRAAASPATNHPARTLEQWQAQWAAAWKDNTHPQWAYFQRAETYYRDKLHLRYPATHRAHLLDGTVPPRTQADIDYINGTGHDTGPPIPCPPHLRERIAAGLANLGKLHGADPWTSGVLELLQREAAGETLTLAQREWISRWHVAHPATNAQA